MKSRRGGLKAKGSPISRPRQSKRVLSYELPSYLFIAKPAFQTSSLTAHLVLVTCPQLVCQLLVSESKVVICSLLPYQPER